MRGQCRTRPCTAKTPIWSPEAGQAAWDEGREHTDQALMQPMALVIFCVVFLELRNPQEERMRIGKRK